jgi:hypothetical protein
MVDSDQRPEDFCDFQIAYLPDLDSLSKNYTEIAYYENSQLSLLKRNQLFKRELISTRSIDLWLKDKFENGVFELNGEELDSGKVYYVEFELNVESNGSISRAVIAITRGQQSDLSKVNHKVKLNTLRKYWNGEVCKTGFILQKIHGKAFNLNAFVDNHHRDKNTKIKGNIWRYEVLK